MKNARFSIKVQAVKMFESGVNMNKIRTTLHVDARSVRLWYAQFKAKGTNGLYITDATRQQTTEEKTEIVEDIINNSLSLEEAVSKYLIRKDYLQTWITSYIAKGPDGLRRKNEGKNMKKKRVYTEAELDELERLRMRNEWLEAENALLKKVKALVEAREARQREIGQKPSKN